MMTSLATPIRRSPPSDYVLAVHELGHAWAFQKVGQQLHHIALGPMKDCPACRALPSPIDNSARTALTLLNAEEYAHVRQPDVEGQETVEQNIFCSLAGAAAQEVCNAVHSTRFCYELNRVVDDLADADLADIEDTFCSCYPGWESDEGKQQITDEMLQMIYSKLLDELPAETIKSMAALLVHKRLLLAEQLMLG
jgi:hypothetical protein